MPDLLTDVQVKEVSLVRRPANRRKFLLFKEDNVDEELIELLKLALENEDEVDEALAKAKLSDKAAKAVKGALRLLTAYKDELPKDIIETLAGLAGYGYAEPEKSEDQAGEDQASEETVDDIAKAADVPDWVKQKIVELEKAAAEANEALQREVAERKAREYLAKAEQYSNIPGEPKELAEILLKADAAGLGDALEKLLESIDTSMSALYSQSGSDAAVSGSGSGIVDDVQKQARALLEKSEDVKTMEQAVTKVLSLHPELYQRYLEETG